MEITIIIQICFIWYIVEIMGSDSGEVTQTSVPTSNSNRKGYFENGIFDSNVKVCFDISIIPRKTTRLASAKNLLIY